MEHLRVDWGRGWSWHSAASPCWPVYFHLYGPAAKKGESPSPGRLQGRKSPHGTQDESLRIPSFRGASGRELGTTAPGETTVSQLTLIKAAQSVEADGLKPPATLEGRTLITELRAHATLRFLLAATGGKDSTSQARLD